MATLAGSVEAIRFDRPGAPEPATPKMTPEHDELFTRVRAAQEDLKAAIDGAEKEVTASLASLKTCR